MSAIEQDGIWRDFFYTEIKTGLRRGEICGLKWTDFNEDEGSLRIDRSVSDGKNGSITIGETKTGMQGLKNQYSTHEMQRLAAMKIDGKGDCEGCDGGSGQTPSQDTSTAPEAKFEPVKGKLRKPGTGCISEINDHLYQGRYSPKGADGKLISKTVYAKTREDCEALVAEMIIQTKAEIQAEKEKLKSKKTA